MRILVVEDDDDIRAVLAHNLARAGHEVEVASGVQQALATAAAEPPDLVVLDLMLPDGSGLDVCRALRSRPATHDVLVVMLTARRTEDDRVTGFELGADDYVTKPFSVRELLLRIEVLARRTRALRAPHLDSAWLARREQVAVWERFSALHFDRGEWGEAMDICRMLLKRYEDALSTAELAALNDRVHRCEAALSHPPAPEVAGDPAR